VVSMEFLVICMSISVRFRRAARVSASWTSP